jgi:hypothetical protein
LLIKQEHPFDLIVDRTGSDIGVSFVEGMIQEIAQRGGNIALKSFRWFGEAGHYEPSIFHA